MSEVYTPDGSLLISPFIWNMKYAEGYLNMTYHGSTLNVDINLTHFKPITPTISVDGYPGVMYGQECWFPFAGKSVSPILKLPTPVEGLPQTESYLTYRLWVKNGSIHDFSYDIWLTQNPNVTYLEYPDVEIMIWLYHQANITSKYYVYEGEITERAIVNGTEMNLTFSVYVLSHTGSSNGWIGVYYLSHQQLEGEVGVPLTDMIQASFHFIDRVFPNLNESSFYLDAIQAGMEFSNDITGTAVMGYSLYNWTIQIG